MTQLRKWLKNLLMKGNGAEWEKQKSRLALILHSGKLSLWIYRPSNRHYYTFSQDGNLEEEFNPVEFSQRYQRDDFDDMQNAIFHMCDGLQQDGKVTLRSSGDAPLRYEISLSIINRNKKGQPTSILGIQHDITWEYQREQEAEQLLMRFQTVFNTALVDMVYYDKEGRLVDINDRACAAFNVEDREMVLNGNFLLENNPMYNHIPLEQMENTRTTALVDFSEYTDPKYRTDDFNLQGKMYYESTINPIRNEHGELEGIYMAGRDITEMVESYHKLKADTERLRQATKAVEKYVADVSYALRVTDIQLVKYNPSTYTLEISNNVSQSSMRFSQLRCIRLATPRFRRVVSSVLNRMDHRTKYNIVQMIESEIRDKQGRQIWLLFNMVPLIDANGEVERYFGMCRNMTDMVETERRLAVESEKARETELLKQAFLTNMSHEIRTPLNTIVGFAELFTTDHDESDEPFFTEQIKVSTNSLLALVNDVLFLSQLDANLMEYKREDVDFAAFFESQCQMGFSNVSPDVKVVVERPYNKLVVDIDAEHVGHIIERLSKMAGTFTLHGTIRCGYEYRRGELTFRIEDTGGGIPAEAMEHIFERFARGENGMHGTGLDLPIVQTLVRQMGGDVDLQSEQGQGTTVWVSIPCTAKVVEKTRESQYNQSEL